MGIRARTLQALSGVLLASCVVAPNRGGPRVYAQLLSTDSACVQNPAYCAAATGVAVESGGVVAVGAGTMVATVVAVEALDLITQSKVEAVLKECADLARSEVLLKRFGGKSPTHPDCMEKVSIPGREDVTMAMLLGEEMHRVAFKCVHEKLGKALPGRYGIEQRYRYDQATKKTTVVTREEELVIKRDGRWSELTGTIVPDVIIHNGHPRFVQAIYDFKFPCVNSDEQTPWRRYTEGPYRGQSQERVYKDALGQDPHRVIPRLGVL